MLYLLKIYNLHPNNDHSHIIGKGLSLIQRTHLCFHSKVWRRDNIKNQFSSFRIVEYLFHIREMLEVP